MKDKQKTCFILLLCGLMPLSCFPDCQFENDYTDSISRPLSSIKPLSDALDDLYLLMSDIALDRTKAEVACFPSIKSIAVLSSSYTRSGDGINCDSLAYLVNFSDNQGYAVLGTDYESEPVYALSEKGELDFDKLTDVLLEITSEDVHQRKDEEDSFEYLYDYIVSSILCDRNRKDRTPNLPPPLPPVYGPWTNCSVVLPLVPVKWGQGYPFNQFMPESDTLITRPTYRGRWPVGCVSVAAAHLMYGTKHPVSLPGTTGCLWNDVSMVSALMTVEYFNAFDYDEFINSDQVLVTETQVSALSQSLATIASEIHSTFNLSGPSTTAYYADCLNYLKQLDPDYYGSAYFASMSDTTSVYGMLDSGKPIYCFGHRPNMSVGHAWIIDGYLYRYRYVYDYANQLPPEIDDGPNSQPNNNIVSTQYSHLLHINWGWQGVNDGYYAYCAYNLQDRVDIEEITDFNPGLSYGNTDYTVDHYYIHY
ncbi:MAG: C10 family peptidase [Bacteroidales bacterium]|nr:C10 family peptidase [Bacteroidales bacterium]